MNEKERYIQKRKKELRKLELEVMHERIDRRTRAEILEELYGR